MNRPVNMVPEPSEQALPPTPGGLLEATRVAAGLSIKQVASRLQISPREVEAMESDRYDELSGALFVRGYLRGYAHLLELPSSMVLGALDKQRPTLVVQGSPSTTTSPPNSHALRPVRNILWWLTTMLVILAGAWWYTQHVSSPVGATPLGASETNPPLAGVQPVSNLSIQAPRTVGLPPRTW